MDASSQTSDLLAPNVRSKRAHLCLPRRYYRVCALILFLGCAGGGRAAGPYAAALDKRFSTEKPASKTTASKVAELEEGLKQQVRKMSQGPVAKPPLQPAVSHTNLNLVTALLVASALAALRFAPRLKRRFGSWFSALASPPDVVPALLEEPSMRAFFEALKEGPAGPVAGAGSLATQAQAPTSAPASDAASERLREFYDATPRRVAELRTLFSEISRAPDEAARQTKLLESFQRASALRESAELPEVLPIWQVGFALEGLLQRLSTQPAGLNPSVMGTAAGAFDLLEHLCRQRVEPNLMTEPPVRLLAVDDDAISRCALSLALTKLFNAPDLACDGQAALALAGRQAYDAIFLDVEMPGMDGFELCRKIHETEINRTAPILFVTCHSDFASHTKSTLNGGCGLLGKPFIVFELVLKAVTLVLKSRLGLGTAEPRAASSEVSDPAAVLDAAPASRAPAPLAPSVPCDLLKPLARGMDRTLQRDTGAAPGAARAVAGGSA